MPGICTPKPAWTAALAQRFSTAGCTAGYRVCHNPQRSGASRELPVSQRMHSHKSSRLLQCPLKNGNLSREPLYNQGYHFLGQVLSPKPVEHSSSPGEPTRRSQEFRFSLLGFFPSLRKSFPDHMCIHNAYIFLIWP